MINRTTVLGLSLLALYAGVSLVGKGSVVAGIIFLVAGVWMFWCAIRRGFIL